MLATVLTESADDAAAPAPTPYERGCCAVLDEVRAVAPYLQLRTRSVEASELAYLQRLHGDGFGGAQLYDASQKLPAVEEDDEAASYYRYWWEQGGRRWWGKNGKKHVHLRDVQAAIVATSAAARL